MALILPAYAKLNLTLDVLGTRPDGYHEIDSVMQTISLHDLISIERTECRVFEVVGAAIDGENIILKAARALEGHVSRALPFTIRLFKRIPIGAGLGGGSSDAAAFLIAANELYGLKLKRADLVEIGAEVGQDVPFFFRAGTAHATGLGATVAPLPAVPRTWRFLVIGLPFQVSTRAVYEAVDSRASSAGRAPRLVEVLSTPHPDPPPQGGRGIPKVSEYFGNDLEPVTRRLFPPFDEALERLRTKVPGLNMTGTGAGLFAVFENEREAETALAAIRDVGYPTWICRPVPAGA